MARRPRRPAPPAPPAARSVPGGVPLDRSPIPPEVRAILEAGGIRSLYPPQAEALGPVYAGESLLLACATASGKSLVAYLALLRAVRAGQTGLYLVPLRALAQEKLEELERFRTIGLRVGVSMGDRDLDPSELETLDVLVATSEKADALLRKGAPWLGRLGCVVADEVHLLRDPDRGPTLEVTLTRLRTLRPALQVIALSATVGNSAEIAEWIGARHIASDFRPIPLRLGSYFDGRITFTDLATRPVPPPGEAVPRLVRTVLQEGGQAIVFVSTRRASEQLAQALVPTVRATMDAGALDRARAAAEELGGTGEEETEAVRRLVGLLPGGIAFHNASLTNSERRVVERAFRDRAIRTLVATPTLAAGINLPARRVIVRDTTRYDDALGYNAPIPAMEVQQMCGRAGRPGLDPAGEAVLVGRSEAEVETQLDRYLSAPPEEVASRLGTEPALRMHLLALVASGAIADASELERFFAATFYGHTRPLRELGDTIRAVRARLEEDGFLERGTPWRATPFGRLTSELYLDPVSALVLRGAIERAPIGVRPFALLAAVSATPDLTPMYLRRGEEKPLLERFLEEQAELLVRPEEEPLRLPLEMFLSTLKTASVLEAWAEETPLVELTERFGIAAGDLRGRVEDASWLLFGATRLAQTFQRRTARPLDALALRVRYGVREELLDLVRLSGIGRVRARALFAAGLPDREALRTAPEPVLGRILRSPAVVASVRSQVGAAPRARPASRSAGPSGPPPGPPAVRSDAVRGRTRTPPLEEYHATE